MNTPTHILLGAALFARPEKPRVSLAALFGALVPDLSLYIMASWSLFVANIPPEVVFRDYYFSDEWQQVFAIDNSFILWGAVLGFAAWRGRNALFAFAGAGLAHVITDFLLHNEDARRHFWPLSDWKFRSPVSYWNPAHYGNIFGPAETALAIVLCVILWRRFVHKGARVAVAAAALTVVAPFFMWIWLISGGPA